MKEFEIKSKKYSFNVRPDGWFKLDYKDSSCPAETGISGDISKQEDKVELGRFLQGVGAKLATPAKGRTLPASIAKEAKRAIQMAIEELEKDHDPFSRSNPTVEELRKILGSLNSTPKPTQVTA